MDDSEYEDLLALGHNARLTSADARRLELEAERRQDFRGYLTGLLRQDRYTDLKRLAYERSATMAPQVADALSRLPAEPAVWTSLLTASAVWSPNEHTVVTRNIDRWPSSVRVAPASWCTDLVAGERPRWWSWVRAVKLLHEDQAHLPRVLELGAMGQIEVFDLSHNDIGDDGVRALAASSCIGALQVLLAVGIGCADEGAIALADSQGLSYLHTLVLSRNDIEAEGAARLIAVNRLSSLASLDLSVNPIDGLALAQLLAKTRARPGGLRALNLEDNGMGAEGIIALVALPHVADVEQLAISGNDILATGVEALASCPLQHVRSLALGSSGLGTPGIAALVQAPWLPRLRMLDLSDNQAGDDGLATLLHSGRLGGLEVLRFARNDLTDLAGRLLEHHTGLTCLRELVLSDNELT